MSFLDDLASAETYGAGNWFKAGRGIVIVKDVKLFKGEKDPQTYVAEFVVKSSQPTIKDVDPNAPGTTVSYPQKLTRAKFPKQSASNAKKCNLAVLGTEAEALSAADLKNEFSELMRIDPATGYTKPGTVCPARGVEVAYETIRKQVNGEFMDFPNFSALPQTPDAIKANRAILDKAAQEESEAV